MKTLLSNLQKLCQPHYLHYHQKKKEEEELIMISKTKYNDQEELQEVSDEEGYQPTNNMNVTC
ncbi:MAG: hypothetical protein ACJ72Q_09805 [Nitrososphaeraceae archaeon]